MAKCFSSNEDQSVDTNTADYLNARKEDESKTIDTDRCITKFRNHLCLPTYCIIILVGWLYIIYDPSKSATKTKEELFATVGGPNTDIGDTIFENIPALGTTTTVTPMSAMTTTMGGNTVPRVTEAKQWGIKILVKYLLAIANMKEDLGISRLFGNNNGMTIDDGGVGGYGSNLNAATSGVGGGNIDIDNEYDNDGVNFMNIDINADIEELANTLPSLDDKESLYIYGDCPCTNIALVLILYPQLRSKIGFICAFMGRETVITPKFQFGSTQVKNNAFCSDFNIDLDPFVSIIMDTSENSLSVYDGDIKNLYDTTKSGSLINELATTNILIYPLPAYGKRLVIIYHYQSQQIMSASLFYRELLNVKKVTQSIPLVKVKYKSLGAIEPNNCKWKYK